MGIGSARDEAAVRGFLAPGGVTAAFPPIVALADRRVVAYEALGRVDGHSLPPDRALRVADRVGRAGDLEMAFWDAVLEAGPPPDGASLFLNLGRAGLDDPRISDRLLALPPYVVVEITEQVATDDTGQALTRAVRQWSSLGIRFAVDDAGAGYSSLKRIVDLVPAFVKLDASLVSGVAEEPRLRAAVEAMAAFATAVGARLVAEGVERSADLAVLVDAGVELAQGFLLGRPGPPWPAPATELIDLNAEPAAQALG